MNQEKFINAYIELLSGTLTESINKNLVLQAQRKVAEQESEEVKNKLVQIENEFNLKLKAKQDEVDAFKHQFNEMVKQRDIFTSETVELKKNVNHIETFKNELIKERAENERLLKENLEKQKKIEKLTTEMAKLLKPEVEAKKTGTKKPPQVKVEETTKDAGKF